MRISANVTFMFSSSFCGTRHAFDPDGSALESYPVVADLACNLNLNSQLQQENASIVLFFSLLTGVLTVSFAPLFARVCLKQVPRVTFIVYVILCRLSEAGGDPVRCA